MHPIHLDLAAKFSVPEAAAHLDVPPVFLRRLLEKGLFQPLALSDDGDLEVPATVLYPILKVEQCDRLTSLERLAELAQRTSEPLTPLGSISTDLLQRKVHEQAMLGRRQLLTDGEIVDLATLAKLLSTETRTLKEAELRGRIFSLPLEGEDYLPRFYACRSLDWRSLEVIFRLVRPSWPAFHFLRTPKPSLRGLSPLDGLRNGNLSAVVDLALTYVGL
jgi:hypothetical protein